MRGSRAFLDLAQDPGIVELVGGVLGDDVVPRRCHVFCKPASEGSPAEGKTGPGVDFARRTPWLVSGIDRSGGNDLEVGHRR